MRHGWRSAGASDADKRYLTDEHVHPHTGTFSPTVWRLVGGRDAALQPTSCGLVTSTGGRPERYGTPVTVSLMPTSGHRGQTPDNHVASSATGSVNRSIQETFTHVYASGRWTLADEGGVSRSGLGSNLTQTAALRSELPRLLLELGISSVLDIPCGDFFWMSRVDLGVDTYIGADIVPELIQRNNELFGRKGREFKVLDISQDQLPSVDLIFCRDCLVHLDNMAVRRSLNNIKRSGATYLAATTFTARDQNEDIDTGGWRPLNLCCEPFSLPNPIRLVDERCTEVYGLNDDGIERQEHFTDKSIGIWRVVDL